MLLYCLATSYDSKFVLFKKAHMNFRAIALPSFAVLLSACGGGSSDIAAPGEKGTRTAIANTLQTVGTTNCASGGSKIETGIDLNSNGVLDSNEVSNTSFVCN